MQYSNRFNAASADSVKWEKTADGFLRCRARILAERVMPYARSELTNLPDGFDGDHVMMYVSKESMSSAESIRSLEGCPIVIGDHKWLSPDVVKQYGVGAVAGTPMMDGPYLVCDMMITDPQAIQDIESGKYPEISAAYNADTIFEQLDFDGIQYDARQTQLRYNHIAIIPRGHGRAGLDIKILNKAKGGNEMSDKAMVRVKLVNTGRFINVDEEVATAIEAETEASAGKEEATIKDLGKTMEELEEKNSSMEELQAEIDSLKGELSVYKEKLDELLGGGAIEAAAEGMVEEQGEASEILENSPVVDEEGEEVDDKEKEAVMNSVKNLRGPALHSAVLSAIGLRVENMAPEALAGAFHAQAQLINRYKGKPVVKVAGARMVNSTIPGETRGGAQAQLSSHQRLGFGNK